MPVLDNILYDTGTGPLTLQDTTYEHTDWKPVSFPGLWWVVTLLAIVSGSMLIADVIGLSLPLLRQPINPCTKSMPCQAVFLLLWGIAIVFSSWNPWLRSYLDRYLLPLALVAILISNLSVSPINGAVGQWISKVSLVILFVFSIGATQDYLAWNRARWAAADFLCQDLSIAPEKIDGGFEFNGLLTSDAFRSVSGSENFTDRGPLRWWVLDNDYAISFLPREGYRIIKQFPYTSWFGLHRGEIKVLKRIEPPL